MKLRAWMIPMLFLVAGVIWLSPLAACPTCIPYQPGAQFSDILISHWPNAEVLRSALSAWREIPLWNPAILSGAPFAADPLAGLWYPPNWLLLVLPLSIAFNLLQWLHLAWAGWGMYRLMRSEGVGQPGAFLAGLAFGGMPKLVGHVGLGHFSLVMAVSWTPWILLLARRVVVGLRLRDSALAGVLLGTVFLIDPRWALPAALLAMTYGIWNLAHSHKETGLRWGRLAANGFLAAVFSAGTAAVLALPLLEFTQLSTRAVLTSVERAVLPLPIGHLIGIFLPSIGGYAEWAAYAGVVVLMLAVVAMVSSRPGWGIWWGVALASLLLSLGDQTPLYGLLAAIPGLNLLRIPPRWLFVFGLSLSILGGKGLDALLAGNPSKAVERRTRLSVVAIGSFYLLLFLGIVATTIRNAEIPWEGWGLTSSIGVAAAAWIMGGLSGRLGIRTLAVGVVSLLLLDLAAVNVSLIDARPVAGAFEPPAFLEDLQLHEGRVFSPSYSLPQHVAAHEGLQLADGVNPMQIAAYQDFMASATGFSQDAYSVTLPPFPSGDPGEDWSPMIDTEQLGLLNVSWIVSAYPLNASGLEIVTEVEGQHLYRNLNARPRAWVELNGGGDDPWRDAAIVEWEPNRITVTASGPGRLVLSEIAYPGWQARLNGERIEIGTAHDVLRSVELPAGEHVIVFSYQPRTVYAGAGLTFLTLVALGILRWWR